MTEFGYRLLRGDPKKRFLDHPLRFVAPAARLGIQSAAVVGSMRTIEQRWVGQVLASAGARAGEVAAIVVRTSAAVYDQIIDGFVADYVVAQSHLNDEALAVKRSTVDALLQPGVDDMTGFDDLGVDLSSHHLGIVLWCPTGVAGSHLDVAVRHLLERTVAAGVLVVPGDNRELWVWLSFASVPTHAERERIRTIPREPNKVGLALGPVSSGILGFRMTHLLARDYAHVAAHLSRAAVPSVADAESLAYVSLLLRDRERAEWFIATELGPMDRGSLLPEREVRETLRIYLGTGQSLADTAERLQIHRNTVVYRLKRIEQAIGRSIASRRHELYAAALLAHLLDQADD